MNVLAHCLSVVVYFGAAAGGGWAAHRFAGVELPVAAVSGVVGFLALTQLHMALTRGGRARRLEKRVDDLAAAQTDAGQRLNVVEARADAVESTLKHELTERRDALVAEMRQLEGLIERLSRSFEGRLQKEASANGAVSPAEDRILRNVREALHQGRVDLHLQPIVSLPQRQVKFYESFSRLRHADGSLILPADFMDAARRANLIGVIDLWMLYRCVQIVRRLAERDRRVGVFCNISSVSLEDDNIFPSFLQFMRQNQDLSGAVILEIEADRFEGRSRAMRENMNRIAALGFRFSLDNVETLSIDLPRLQDSGVRFVKVAGQRLLRDLVPGGPRPISSINAQIAPEDVSAVFERYGVAVIAEKMEDEASVVEILALNVPFGQGHVFGSPRPVKASLMEETTPPPGFLPDVSAGRATN
jgi:cyclic-di-GMP phosphodiesterase TipF (flagellum assembly factor)